MIGYFKERSSFQVPALLFLTLALKITFVYHPHTDVVSQPGGLLAPWLDTTILPRLQPSFSATLSIIILFFSATFANYLMAKGRMFTRNNMLVALCMLLFTSLFPASNQLSAATLLLPAVILLFHQFTRLYNVSHPRPVLINIGMIMGSGYLLYHPFIWLLPYCFIGLAIMRTFRMTEWLLFVLGFITPIYFLLSYEFLINHWNPARHLLSWKFYTRFPSIELIWWIVGGVAAIWLMASLSAWQNQTRRMLIQSRKSWYQLIFMGVFIVPMAVLPIGNGFEAITLLSFPAGCMAANAFSSRENTMNSILLFWLLIITIAFAGWRYTHG